MIMPSPSTPATLVVDWPLELMLGRCQSIFKEGHDRKFMAQEGVQCLCHNTM